MQWKRVERSIQIGIAGIVAYFLFDTIRASWDQLVTYSFSPSLPTLGVALVLILSAFLMVWLRWHLTLKYLGESIALGTSGAIYAFFQVSTYIPGGIWQFLQLNYLAHKADVSKKTITGSMLQHQIIGILGAGTVFVAFGGATFFHFNTILVAGILAFGLITSVAYPPILERLVNPFLHKMDQDELDIQIGYERTLSLVLIATGSWLVTTVGFVFLLQAFTSISFQPALLAIFPAAWLSGFLLLLAPGGLGVREAALTTLLTTYVSRTDALVMAGISRLWTIFPEIVFGLFFFLTSVRHQEVFED